MTTCRFLVEQKKEQFSEQEKSGKKKQLAKQTLSLAGISERTAVLTYGRARAFLPDETERAIICIQIDPGVSSDWVTTILEKNFKITLTPADPMGKRRCFYR